MADDADEGSGRETNGKRADLSRDLRDDADVHLSRAETLTALARVLQNHGLGQFVEAIRALATYHRIRAIEQQANAEGLPRTGLGDIAEDT